MFEQHLRRFAERFLTRQKIIIEKLTINRQDINDDIFKKLKYDDEIQNDKNAINQYQNKNERP